MSIGNEDPKQEETNAWTDVDKLTAVASHVSVLIDSLFTDGLLDDTRTPRNKAFTSILGATVQALGLASDSMDIVDAAQAWEDEFYIGDEGQEGGESGDREPRVPIRPAGTDAIAVPVELVE